MCTERQLGANWPRRTLFQQRSMGWGTYLIQAPTSNGYLLENWGYARQPRHFFLKKYVQEQNCLRRETFGNRGTTVYTYMHTWNTSICTLHYVLVLWSGEQRIEFGGILLDLMFIAWLYVWILHLMYKMTSALEKFLIDLKCCFVH